MLKTVIYEEKYLFDLSTTLQKIFLGPDVNVVFLLLSKIVKSNSFLNSIVKKYTSFVFNFYYIQANN